MANCLQELFIESGHLARRTVGAGFSAEAWRRVSTALEMWSIRCLVELRGGVNCSSLMDEG